jgi:hypothetical protein
VTSIRPIAFVLALTLLAAALFQGRRLLSHQQAKKAAGQQRIENLNRQLTAQDQAREATLRDLTAAETQLAELSHRLPSVPTSDPRGADPEFAPWIARVKRLREVFEQNPPQKIPEMRLLTDDDWLLIARQNRLDSEDSVRQALAAIRAAAKDRFVVTLNGAVRRYIAAAPADQTVALSRPGRDGATKGRTAPARASELAPYLENPADSEILNRLEVFNLGTRWVLQEKSPIDADYDGGYRVSSNSGYVPRAPWAWFPPDIDERSMRADNAYQTANGGRSSTGWADSLPYFDPPLEPEIAERILRAEREQRK